MKKLIFGVALLVVGVSLYFVFDHVQNMTIASIEAVPITEVMPTDETVKPSMEIKTEKILKGVSIFDTILNSIQKLFSVVSAGIGLYITFFEAKKRLFPKRRKR